MKSAFQFATMLPLLALALSACQSEGPKKARVRATALERLGKAAPQAKGEIPAADTASSVSTLILCLLNRPETCTQIASPVLSDGSLDNFDRAQAAQISPEPLAVSALPKSGTVTRAQIELLTEAQASALAGKKLALVTASIKNSEKLNQILDEIEFKNVEEIQVDLDTKDKKDLAIENSTAILLLTEDQASQSMALAQIPRLQGANVNRMIVTPAHDSYHIEAQILNQIGVKIPLHFLLAAKKSELKNIGLKVNDNEVAKEDFDVIDSEKGAVIRIINRSILKNASDKIEINFESAKAPSENEG